MLTKQVDNTIIVRLDKGEEILACLRAVCAEYGVAHLRGQSLASRTKQLIAIAHPDFRDELTFEAKKRGIMI